MTEGPYRDLGSGFARLTGVEGARRAPSRVQTVEDALLELVRNAVDAGAENVYVATALHARRYRELVVLDDGRGVPEAYRDLIFEPGVTTRHLSPSRLTDRTEGANGSGLSLHHVKEAALSAALLSTRNPTSVKAVFDTRETLPERSLQSRAPGTDKTAKGAEAGRVSQSNLRATLVTLAASPEAPDIFYGSPASTLALLLCKRIIPEDVGIGELEQWCEDKLGVRLSRRTLQRVVKGVVAPSGRIEEIREVNGEKEGVGYGKLGAEAGSSRRGGRLVLDERDVQEIRGVIERAARESYLEVGELAVENGEGGITLKAEVYEAEEEYDE